MEIDSQEYHFYRADWLRTEAKRSRLLKHGIFPHNIAPVRVERDWDAVCAEITSSLDKGRQRPRLPIVAFPCGSQAPAESGRGRKQQGGGNGRGREETATDGGPPPW